MRTAAAVAAVVLAAVPVMAQTPTTRHGVALDLKAYPQGTPQETLASVLKAVKAQRIDYVLAQLADPHFVDERAKTESSGFAALVREATEKLVADPTAVRLLSRLAEEGAWKVEENAATVALKEGGDRGVTFRKLDGRWVMQNQYRPRPMKRRRGGE
jgi:hypothetical protein